MYMSDDISILSTSERTTGLFWLKYAYIQLAICDV